MCQLVDLLGPRVVACFQRIATRAPRRPAAEHGHDGVLRGAPERGAQVEHLDHPGRGAGDVPRGGGGHAVRRPEGLLRGHGPVVMASIRTRKDDKELQITVPKTADFVHECCKAFADRLLSDPMLAVGQGTARERAYKRDQLDRMVNKCVRSTLRGMLPVKQMMRSYLDDVLVEDDARPAEKPAGGEPAAGGEEEDVPVVPEVGVQEEEEEEAAEGGVQEEEVVVADAAEVGGEDVAAEGGREEVGAEQPGREEARWPAAATASRWCTAPAPPGWRPCSARWTPRRSGGRRRGRRGLGPGRAAGLQLLAGGEQQGRGAARRRLLCMSRARACTLENKIPAPRAKRSPDAGRVRRVPEAPRGVRADRAEDSALPEGGLGRPGDAGAAAERRAAAPERRGSGGRRRRTSGSEAGSSSLAAGPMEPAQPAGDAHGAAAGPHRGAPGADHGRLRLQDGPEGAPRWPGGRGRDVRRREGPAPCPRAARSDPAPDAGTGGVLRGERPGRPPL